MILKQYLVHTKYIPVHTEYILSMYSVHTMNDAVVLLLCRILCWLFPLPAKRQTSFGRRLVMAARMMVPEMKCELDLYECVLVQT